MKFVVKKVDDLSFIRIDNERGLDVILCSFGASVYSLEVVGRNNLMESVVMTPSNMEDFKYCGANYGKTIGRFCGRIANHSCNINGVTYELENNDNGNCLHAGKYNVSYQNFAYEIIEDKDNIQVIFRHHEKENQLPGNVDYGIIYTVYSNTNELRIDYKAETDKDTLFNPSNHTYFNLSGNLKRDVKDQVLKYYCDRFTNLNDHMITKSIDKVNKVMNFKIAHKIGNHIEDPFLQNHPAKGYDHCWIKKDISKDLIATLTDFKSQRRMKVYTSYPCVVSYSCNYPDSFDFLPNNIKTNKYYGICFETQFIPNGINMENVDKAILKKGEKYHQYARFVFETL